MRARLGGRRILLAVMTLLALVAAGASCETEARGVESCRRIEAARCERAPGCIEGFAGTADSCKRFYDVHCGSGIQPQAKEPTSVEVDSCLRAISASCDAVRDPTTTPECSFLVAQLPVVDSGAEIATDAPADVLDSD